MTESLEDNPLTANPTETIANRAAAQRLFAIITSAILVLGVAFWLSYVGFDYRDLAWPLAITMSLGPLAAAVWLYFQRQFDQIAPALLVALGLGIASWVAAFIGGHSLASYWFFLFMGPLPFLLLMVGGFGYQMVIHRLITKPIWDWQLILALVVTVLVPWVWAASRTYGAFKRT